MTKFLPLVCFLAFTIGPQLEAVSDDPSVIKAAEQFLAADPESRDDNDLIRFDLKLDEIESKEAKGVQTRILAELAKGQNPSSLEYIRSIFESRADRRHDAAYALSLSAIERPVNLQDWRFLVRSLTVVEGEQAVSVLKALKRFRQRATKPEWIRQVILIALRLPEDQQPHAIRLLEYWSGEKLDQPGQSSAETIAAYQKWFEMENPESPKPVLPVDPPGRKWTYAKLLPELDDLKSDPETLERGRVIYKKAKCHTCHQKDKTGEHRGPDLSSLGWRRQKKEILEALLYPSQVIHEEYVTSIVVTKDGKVLTGLLTPGKDRDQLLVVDLNNKESPLAKTDIEEIRDSPVSNMPDGLLEPFSLEEIRDLFAYLVSGKAPGTHPGGARSSSAN
jgi:putative heme-binding domain-containing protein